MSINKSLGYIRSNNERKSLTEQENAIRKFAKENNYEVSKIFSDYGKSNKGFRRKGLEAMLQYIWSSPQKIKTLVVVDRSRLSRKIEEFRTIIQFLKDTRIKLISLSDLKSKHTRKQAKQ